MPTLFARSTTAVRIGASFAALALIATACSSKSSSGGGTSAATPPSTRSSTAATVIETHSGAAGTFLTDSAGRTLYLWDADTGSTSTCTGSCASAWPPVTTTGTPTTSGSAKAADLGTTARSDGTKQLTYAGHPLYYFTGDSAPGQTNGQGNTAFGAAWWMVDPTGNAISATTSSSSNSSSGYGSGY